VHRSSQRCLGSRLVDHLVGDGEHARRNFEAERHSGLDDEFKLGGLLDQQIGRFLALEDAAGVDASWRKLSIAYPQAKAVLSMRGLARLGQLWRGFTKPQIRR
jgi:hypothetical protein